MGCNTPLFTSKDIVDSNGDRGSVNYTFFIK